MLFNKIFENFGSDLIKEKAFSIDNILISSSLKKIGLNKKVLNLIPENSFEIKKYSFFQAGLLSAYSNPLPQKLAKYSFSHIYWTCQAHNLALVLENVVLQNENG